MLGQFSPSADKACQFGIGCARFMWTYDWTRGIFAFASRLTISTLKVIRNGVRIPCIGDLPVVLA